jgi:hypothetical protein
MFMNARFGVPSRESALVLALLGASLASQAVAQDLRYRDGRFLETSGGVTLQRADEAGSDEAVRNMPFLPGDRVWTDEAGRAEIVFADGEILWIAERSKVDSLGRGGRDQDERLGLRVFAGSFGARVRSGGPGFEFRAPGGSVTSTGTAAFRLDVRAGETSLSVSEGEVLADLGGERMTLRGGERIRYAAGRVDGPSRYQRAAADSFDRWCEERSDELNRIARRHDRLPDELDAYGDELDRNGDWVYDEPQGYVYVPRVDYGWSPYTYGRWTYTVYGWTWVADEPWGFVTSHYGRWGYSSRIGWHWMPRLGFAGAWVSWSSPVGRWSNVIGWCALGFDNRPIGSSSFGMGRDWAGRPGESRATSAGRGWSFANRSDMGRVDIRRRRVELPVDEAQRAVVWNPDTTPDREFRQARAVSFGRKSRGSSARDDGGRIYVRPSPGDSTPELRSDPATTIPSPESRRGRTIGQDGFKNEQDNRPGRAWRYDPGLSPNDGGPSDRSEARPAERGGRTPQAGFREDPTAREGSIRERPVRDPLLDRFFRSITRPSSTDRLSDPPRNNDSATPRKDAPSRDDSSARESSPRERPRPQEARPPEVRRPADNQERSRPADDQRGSRRRSQKER